MLSLMTSRRKVSSEISKSVDDTKLLQLVKYHADNKEWCKFHISKGVVKRVAYISLQINERKVLHIMPEFGMGCYSWEKSQNEYW